MSEYEILFYRYKFDLTINRFVFLVEISSKIQADCDCIKWIEKYFLGKFNYRT